MEEDQGGGNAQRMTGKARLPFHMQGQTYCVTDAAARTMLPTQGMQWAELHSIAVGCDEKPEQRCAPDESFCRPSKAKPAQPAPYGGKYLQGFKITRFRALCMGMQNG